MSSCENGKPLNLVIDIFMNYFVSQQAFFLFNYSYGSQRFQRVINGCFDPKNPHLYIKFNLLAFSFSSFSHFQCLHSSLKMVFFFYVFVVRKKNFASFLIWFNIKLRAMRLDRTLTLPWQLAGNGYAHKMTEPFGDQQKLSEHWWLAWN